MRRRLAMYLLLPLAASSCVVDGEPALTTAEVIVPSSIHAWWQLPDGSNWLAEYITVTREPAASSHYFFATNFWVTDASGAAQNFGGYIGLQTGAQRVHRDPGKIAIFSMWNAHSATPGSLGAWCAPFGGEGVGMSCRFPVEWRAGVPYYLSARVTGTSPGGNPLWTGYVVETDTGAVVELGTIEAPATADTVSPIGASWIENWGDTPDCSTLSIAQAWFSRPYGFGDTVAGHYYAFDPGTECQAAVPDQGSAAIQFGADPIPF